MRVLHPILQESKTLDGVVTSWNAAAETIYGYKAGEIIGKPSIAHDITEHKRAEELARTTSQYARSLIEASADPIFATTEEGKACRLRRTEAHFVRRKASLVVSIPGSSRDRNIEGP